MSGPHPDGWGGSVEDRGSPASASRAAPGDLALLGGRVITLDAVDTIAEAALVSGGRIRAVGSRREIEAACGAACRRLELEGRAVMPGLIDGHAHLDREGLKTVLPSLAGARSIADILERIAGLVREAAPGAWIVTNPIGDPPEYAGVPGNLREGRLPDRFDLDGVAPDNPVYIRAPWGYWPNALPIASVANSLALRLAGIDAETASPSRLVTIVKDERTGEPTGVFLEATPSPLVEFTLMQAAPNFTHGERCAALSRSMAAYAGFGTTGVFEGHGVAPEVISAYQALRQAGTQTLRAHLVFSPGWSGAARDDIPRMLASWAKWLSGRALGDEWLKVAGLYTEIDDGPEGALRARLAPQTGWAGFSPDAGLPREGVATLLREAARNKIRVAGIWPYLIDLFAEADRAAPIAEARWVLGHQAALSGDDIARLADLGIVLTTHTNRHIYKDGAKLRDRLGEARAHDIVPLRRLLDAGVTVSFGSDNLPPSLFGPIWHAVARQERERGEVIAPAQRISRLEALRCASTAGAYLCFDEAERGSIEVSKLADLAVLSDNPLDVDLDRLAGITSVMTIVGGRIVHETARGR